MYIAKTDSWYLERIVWLIAGIFSLSSAVLAWVHSPYWLILTALVGINLISVCADRILPDGKHPLQIWGKTKAGEINLNAEYNHFSVRPPFLPSDNVIRLTARRYVHGDNILIPRRCYDTAFLIKKWTNSKNAPSNPG